MELTLSEPRLLKESMNIISELVNEVTLRVDKDKIEIIAIDPANVAMVDFKLLSSAFLEYSVPKPQELAINLEHLKQILKRAKPSDTVSLALDEDKNRLKIVLKGDGTRTFNIPLITIDEAEQKLPSLQFATKVMMSSSRFDDAIEDMSIISESLSLTSFPDKFLIKSESNLKDAVVEIQARDDTSIRLDGDALSSKYSIEYLKKISKANKLADQVSLEFGADYPLRAEYTLMDKLRLSFILAPRVSND
ncbi:proliferating cell nuclear antigen (pcna) [Candidatus Woesearchaeota archaeon]|nr:proliferating cell nuclear antigen (pcna) [Candidatus Woesearchaeota archaeon]